LDDSQNIVREILYVMNIDRNTMLHLICENDNSIELLEELGKYADEILSLGYLTNIKKEYPFGIACRKRNLPLMKKLIDYNYSGDSELSSLVFNNVDACNMGCLQYCYSNLELFEYLLNHKYCSAKLLELEVTDEEPLLHRCCRYYVSS